MRLELNTKQVTIKTKKNTYVLQLNSDLTESTALISSTDEETTLDIAKKRFAGDIAEAHRLYYGGITDL
jgi:hypothetical protein